MQVLILSLVAIAIPSAAFGVLWVLEVWTERKRMKRDAEEAATLFELDRQLEE